jgi:hypothetical protein
VILGSSQTIRAADGQSPADFQPLFNGSNLDGWEVYQGKGDQWFAAGGELRTSNNLGYRTSGWLMTRDTYSDFELRLEYKLGARGNSGIALRSPFEGDPAFAGMEVALLDDASYPQRKPEENNGSIWGLSTPRQAAALPAGQWNRMRLIANRRRVSVYINGSLVQDLDLDDYRGQAARFPGVLRDSGRIGLQNHTGDASFRNIQIRSLAGSEPPPESIVALDGESKSGFRTLFSGNDLDGWEVYQGQGNQWSASRGELQTFNNRGFRTAGWLMTRDTYSDFELRLEYKLGARGNSGIALHSPLEGDPAYTGMEVQLLDDATYTGLKPEQYSGSIYGLSAPRQAAAKPAGQWNRVRLIANQRRVTVYVNDTLVQDLDLDGYKDQTEKFPGVLRDGGRIGLQNHTGDASFRNIEIKELTSGSAGPALYVLSIGINDYADQRLKLDCAAPDARDIRQAFLTNSRRQFPGGVEARLLLDAQATRANILEGLQWLDKKARGNDVAVVFYAGHGDSRIEGQFYLVPFDANLRKLAASGVSGESLRKALGDLPCTTMLILDACDSGGFDARAIKTRKTRALPTATDTMLRQMVHDEGLVVMCGAAKGTEAAEENGHGFFTRAIVEGLAGKADFFKKGRVELYDLQAYVKTRVGQLSGDEQEPTISIPSTVRSFSLAKP